ncbi:hypothetical protein D1F64_07110 [Breoghania sp. L-A4]|nr:hypothetical protein D1F64_07110 [Breoghania sp. L-A4]
MARLLPKWHYTVIGWKSRRKPGPLFEPEWYLESNPDVRESGVEPLYHYTRWGAAELRNPNQYFDAQWYLATNPDVAAAKMDPLLHYRQFGWREGRNPCPDFDIKAYLAQNPEVAKSGIEPLAHFLEHLGQPTDSTSSLKDAHQPPLQPQRRQPRKHVVMGRGGQAQFASPLIIGGFHRSGTSLTANLLHNAGLHLGDNLLGAHESNPFGHYEDLEVIEFHNRLLANAGTDWQTSKIFLPSVATADWNWLAEYGMRKSRYPAWGVKDPRICLFLPEWQRVFPGMSILYVFRPCVQCVHSLKKRAAAHLRRNEAVGSNIQFWKQPDLAVNMYLTYSKKALQFLETFEGRSLVVSIDDLVRGRDVFDTLRDSWGYPLKRQSIGGIFDESSMTDAGPNEFIHDERLLEEIERVEHRFARLVQRDRETLMRCSEPASAAAKEKHHA